MFQFGQVTALHLVCVVLYHFCIFMIVICVGMFLTIVLVFKGKVVHLNLQFGCHVKMVNSVPCFSFSSMRFVLF